jgi:hypothetical protein
MPDEPISYIDYERFSDGSRRWTWRIFYLDRLWRAGVTHHYPDAREQAHSSWEELRTSLPDGEREKLWGAKDMEILDWKRLRQGPGDDDDAA